MNITVFIIWLTCILGYTPSDAEVERELARGETPTEVIGVDQTGG